MSPLSSIPPSPIDRKVQNPDAAQNPTKARGLTEARILTETQRRAQVLDPTEIPVGKGIEALLILKRVVPQILRAYLDLPPLPAYIRMNPVASLSIWWQVGSGCCRKSPS